MWCMQADFLVDNSPHLTHSWGRSVEYYNHTQFIGHLGQSLAVHLCSCMFVRVSCLTSFIFLHVSHLFIGYVILCLFFLQHNFPCYSYFVSLWCEWSYIEEEIQRWNSSYLKNAQICAIEEEEFDCKLVASKCIVQAWGLRLEGSLL